MSRSFVNTTENKGTVENGPCADTAYNIYHDQNEFDSQLDAQVGDTFYANSDLSVTFNGGMLWYSVADTLGGDADVRNFKIAGDGKIIAIEACVVPPTPTATEVPATPTPTATEVPEPTPTPTVAFNQETISFAAPRDVNENGYNWCDQPTRDTYTYSDDGIFEVGDSITGAVPNDQKARLVTAATGSAVAQIGKVFHFTEDEIMGIFDCVAEPTPTPTATAVPDPTATPVPEPTATPVPEPTPTATEAVSDDPTTLYFFHGGGGGYPGVSDLTASDATYYYTEEGGTTTDLGVTFGAMMENSPAPYTQENGTGLWPIIGSMEFGADETITNSYKQWEYFITGGGYHGGRENYYLVVPNNESFPEDLVTSALVANLGNNIPVQMAGQKDFTWNGDNYTMYILPLSSSNSGQDYKFLGSQP